MSGGFTMDPFRFAAYTGCSLMSLAQKAAFRRLGPAQKRDTFILLLICFSLGTPILKKMSKMVTSFVLQQ